MDTKAKVESAYKQLFDKIVADYMDGKVKTSDAILDEILMSADEKTIDGFKNLILGRYKEYIYDTIYYPFFTCEDDYVMKELAHIIKQKFGEDFLQNHKLDPEHWMFADGSYAFLFTPDFKQAVYKVHNEL